MRVPALGGLGRPGSLPASCKTAKTRIAKAGPHRGDLNNRDGDLRNFAGTEAGREWRIVECAPTRLRRVAEPRYLLAIQPGSSPAGAAARLVYPRDCLSFPCFFPSRDISFELDTTQGSRTRRPLTCRSTVR
jgi:hypothetical protein